MKSLWRKKYKVEAVLLPSLFWKQLDVTVGRNRGRMFRETDGDWSNLVNCALTPILDSRMLRMMMWRSRNQWMLHDLQASCALTLVVVVKRLQRRNQEQF
jgi:hypothetical protein